MNREQLVRIARDAAAGINRPSYCKNPSTFDPHEWVLDAMLAAYKAGAAESRARDRLDGDAP